MADSSDGGDMSPASGEWAHGDGWEDDDDDDAWRPADSADAADQPGTDADEAATGDEGPGGQWEPTGELQRRLQELCTQAEDVYGPMSLDMLGDAAMQEAVEEAVVEELHRLLLVQQGLLQPGQDMSLLSRKQPAATDEQIDELPMTRLTNDVLLRAASQDCAVCMEAFQPGAWAVELPCKHLFCRPCIVRWLEQRRSCPRCRHDITLPPPRLPPIGRRRREQKAPLSPPPGGLSLPPLRQGAVAHGAAAQLPPLRGAAAAAPPPGSDAGCPPQPHPHSGYFGPGRHAPNRHGGADGAPAAAPPPVGYGSGDHMAGSSSSSSSGMVPRVGCGGSAKLRRGSAGRRSAPFDAQGPCLRCPYGGAGDSTASRGRRRCGPAALHRPAAASGAGAGAPLPPLPAAARHAG